jgi:hypothetical protein
MQLEEGGLDKLEKTQNAPQSIKTVAHFSACKYCPAPVPRGSGS